MHSHLFFICPTDHLEVLINKEFRHKNFIVSSLGNTMIFDFESISEINELIQVNNVGHITFILAHDNRIMLDAMEHQELAEINGLNSLGVKMKKHHKHTQIWRDNEQSLIALSYHLSDKIKELNCALKDVSHMPVHISGKIYIRHKDKFQDIYSDIICRNFVLAN